MVRMLERGISVGLSSISMEPWGVSSAAAGSPNAARRATAHSGMTSLFMEKVLHLGGVIVEIPLYRTREGPPALNSRPDMQRYTGPLPARPR